MSQREKTNSITHLVKIVAEEVIDTKLSAITKYIDRSMAEAVRVELGSFIVERQPPGDRTGEHWSTKEDNYLRLLYDEFLNNVAVEFKRSQGAIRARIDQQN